MKAKFLILFIVAFCVWGCKKDDSITTDPSAKLDFSVDTIFFDTVFTSLGSTTKRIKVFNRNKKAVKISQIKLGGGATSSYQININGVASTQLPDVELRGNDSLNVFVKVTINPTSNQLPFIVKDSIEFLTNGNQQKVILTAYGQNAVFLKDAVINANTVWDNKLPYVIYNSVTVSADKTLTIQQGSRIYFHKDAELKIAGTLKVNGAFKDSVTFTSDRLETLYEDEPGQWSGIHFLRSSKENHINYALIKNGIIGVKVDSLSETSTPKLLLTNTIIHNMELVGLSCNNADVAGFNNVIANCGRHLIHAVNGGRYNFKQNTFAHTSFQFSRSTPALFFTDQSSQSKTSEVNLTLINNIIWGNLQNELVVEKRGTLPFTQVIRKNLIKSTATSLEASGNLLNADPMFKNAKKIDYALLKDSPALNKGESLLGDTYYPAWLSKDLKGRQRLFPSDLGSYEFF